MSEYKEHLKPSIGSVIRDVAEGGETVFDLA